MKVFGREEKVYGEKEFCRQGPKRETGKMGREMEAPGLSLLLQPTPVARFDPHREMRYRQTERCHVNDRLCKTLGRCYLKAQLREVGTLSSSEEGPLPSAPVCPCFTPFTPTILPQTPVDICHPEGYAQWRDTSCQRSSVLLRLGS